MTKKSFARLERDAAQGKSKDARKARDNYFKANTGWDDCRDLYHSAAEMIVGTGETIRQGYSDKEVFKFFNHQEAVEVNTAIVGMNQDLQMFTDQLLAIFSIHRERSGAVSTDEDFSAIIELAQAYSDFTTRFSAVVSPNQRFLTAKLGVAIDRRVEFEKEAAALAAQDPAVITDVSVK